MIIILVGTKLRVIITKMGLRFLERGVIKGTPVVEPGDHLFWFNKPSLLLFLIHLVLFQNAFQLAFFAWSWDGYTKEITGQEAVRALVAVRAKLNRDRRSTQDREFFKSFLEVLNRPQHSGRFNITTEFPYYKQIHFKPDFRGKKLGKIVVFDMDMSPGDFLALFYLLKLAVEIMKLKETFLGEILGAVFLAGDHPTLDSAFAVKRIKISVTGAESEDGQITIDENKGKSVKVLEKLNPVTYYGIKVEI